MKNVDYKEIDDIVKMGLKLNNSVFKIAKTEEGNVNEVITEVISKIKGKDFIGKETAIRDIIEQSGAIKNGVIDYNHPFMVSARSGILQDIFEKSMKFQRDLDSIRMDEIVDNRAKDKIITNTLSGQVDEAGDLIPIQPEFDITKLNKLVSELKDDEYLKQFFNASDLEAIKNIDRYFTIINAANPKIGSVLQQAELSADLVKNMFNAPGLFNVGTTLVKYDLLARALSKPVTQEILQGVTNDQLRSNPAQVIKALLTSLTREISDDFGTGYDESVLEGVGGYDLMSDVDDDRPPDALNVTLPTLDSMDKGAELPTVNSQVPIANNSTLSQANVINPNTMAAGQSVFGQDDPVFSGIMSTNVGRQRVA